MDGQQWTTIHELLAIQAELIDQWGLLGARIQTGGKGLPTRGLQISRPSDRKGADPESKPSDRVISDPREIAAWFS